MNSYRYVLSMIMERAYKYDPLNQFTLSSGAASDYYVDCRQITMDGHIMWHIAQLIENELAWHSCDKAVQAIGGVTMGADPIAAAYACYAEINMFSVRKEAKPHGMTRIVEGPKMPPTTRVIIVEDTVTTGRSTLYSITGCLKNQWDILGIISLVDRQEHDYQSLWKKHIPEYTFISSIYTADVLRKAHNGGNRDGVGGGLLSLEELEQYRKSSSYIERKNNDFLSRQN